MSVRRLRDDEKTDPGTPPIPKDTLTLWAVVALAVSTSVSTCAANHYERERFHHVSAQLEMLQRELEQGAKR